MNSIQVKVCGITRAEDAQGCMEAGVDAIGCIFYDKSPRYVSLDRAAKIAETLRSRGADGRPLLVGVFVDSPLGHILHVAGQVSLDMVQLHGTESPSFVAGLEERGLRVIKTLFGGRKPFYSEVLNYSCQSFLAEDGSKGSGGTGIAWNWGKASDIKLRGRSLVIAGGINPMNILDALISSKADGVDVNSGVEISPGVKDLSKIKELLGRVRSFDAAWEVQRVFTL